MMDAMLLGSIQRGNQAALEQLIDKYSAYVCTIIRHAAGQSLTHEDIEETASDVFLALWDKADKVRKVKSWLGAAARNKARNKLREKKDEISLDEEIRYDEEKGLEDAIIAESDKTAIKTAILSMKAPDCEIFLRHYYAGETTAAIGRETGMKESAVQQRLVRGREKLRLILEQEGSCE